MTAIAGLFRFDGTSVDPAVLERMKNLLTPYGNDAQNHVRQGGVGLLRTLLRTTPEDSFDRQPLRHAQSDTWLVFDGRIDNRDDLIRELNIPQPEAVLLADSDLVLRAVMAWDIDAARHFVGDFALACWQNSSQRLWLARDPLGHRPLFWHKQPGFFAFATMSKALFAIPGVPRAICEERLADRLTLAPMIGPESFYKDIYRVEPGHVVIFEDGKVRALRYHAFDPDRELQLPSDDDYLEAFREKLEQAVASQLRSNGPIASHLSSGFDSSTVTALAALQLGKQGKRVAAYTAAPREGFDGPVPRGRHADESSGAKALADRFDNIDHIVLRPDGTSPLDSLQQQIEILGRDVTNPCNMVWMDGIQKDAHRRGARVLLTGQMGNMTISYSGEQYLPKLLGQGKLRHWWHEAGALKRAHPERLWRGLIAQSVGPYLPKWLWSLIGTLRDSDYKLRNYSAIHPDFMARIGTLDRFRQANWDISYRPWADGRRMRIAVLNRQDNGEYQVAANQCGLDMRDPTSDLRLIEFCLAVPDSQFLRNGQSRWLLKRLMGNTLPPEITNTKSKGLQAADWYEATAKALPAIQEELQRMKNHEAIGNYLDLDALLADLEDWPESGWARSKVVQKYRLKLLRGLSVGAFIRYIETENH